jgi:hypothetical protein
MDNNLKQYLTELALEKEASLFKGLTAAGKTFTRKVTSRVHKAAAPTKGFQGVEQIGINKFTSPVTKQVYPSASKARRASRAANKANPPVATTPPVAAKPKKPKKTKKTKKPKKPSTTSTPAPTSNQNFAVGAGVLGGAAVGAGAMYAGTRERKKVAER